MLPSEVQRILDKPDRPQEKTVPLFSETDCKHVVLIILDGVSRRVFESASVPFIRSLQRRGAYYTNCLTSFPTMTASTHSSINTGSYPETHSVGMDTGDQVNVLDNSIYLSNALKQAGLTSSSVADPTFKGAFSYLSVEYFGHSIAKTGAMARWSFETFHPSFLTVTFYAPDTLSHSFGPGHEHVYNALTVIDGEVEKIVDTVTQVSDLASTLFVITADHGQVGSDFTVSSIFQSFGEIGIDFVPSSGGRNIILNCPTDEQLEKWINNEYVLKVLSPNEVRLLGHHCAADRYVVCLKENYVWERTHNISVHGGLTMEERNVPLVLSGHGVIPGVYQQMAEGIDIAPTATALLGGVYLPTYQGRILSEAFKGDLPINSDELIAWRRQRETWINAPKKDSTINTDALLLVRRRLEREYRQAVKSLLDE